MRKKTLTTQEVLRVKARGTLKDTSEVSSEKEYSDNSSMYNRRRNNVVLTKEELAGLNK